MTGTIHNGFNKVIAQFVPGVSGTIEVTFDIVVLSVTASTFDKYRKLLGKLLISPTEEQVAAKAGIQSPPPPEAASRMASYSSELFSSVVFGGLSTADQDVRFNGNECTHDACGDLISLTRKLPVTEVSFSGKLFVNSSSPARSAIAYVPTTSIEYDDGLTITFAGYSDNVLVDDGGIKPLSIPAGFWSEKKTSGSGAVDFDATHAKPEGSD